jgi:hypothetical protein
MIMHTQFDTARYDLVKTDKVRIANHRFGHNEQAELDVWIESSDKGERFLSQLIIEGTTYAKRKEVYTTSCYILLEKATGLYWFLDMNDSGFWLHNESFFGAQTFYGDEALKIQNWLTSIAN